MVLAVIGIGLVEHGGKGLSPDMSASEILAGFAAHASEARLGAAVIGAAVLLNVLFLGALWSRLRKGAEWLAAVALAGGAVGAMLLLLQGVLALGAVVAADSEAAETARMLLVLEWEYARTVVPPTLAVVGAATIAGLRHAVFPRWFSWMSLAFAVLLTLALLPFGPAGLLGASGGLWVITASLVLAFGAGRQPTHR